MPKLKTTKNNAFSAWPRRWALALCCLTFPLLWIGGLVTTTDAGMAVPDWPSTYGYNMFAYPWQTWLFGPWDLFIEHGHRLLASVVGMVTIGLTVSVWRCDARGWLRWLSLAVLLLVIFQGVLGGVRVVENERLIAMAHGCTGPLFFALTTVLLAATSRVWAEAEPKIGATNRRPTVGRDSVGLLIATALLAYLQLTLGAQLRHVPEDASPWAFAAVVKLHLIMAGVVALHILAAAWRVLTSPHPTGRVRVLCLWLFAALVIQLVLGGGTWLLKYGSPGWAVAWLPANMGATVADGWTQTHVVTAHSACGSLILGLATAAAAYALRFAAPLPSPSLPAAPAEGHAA